MQWSRSADWQGLFVNDPDCRFMGANVNAGNIAIALSIALVPLVEGYCCFYAVWE